MTQDKQSEMWKALPWKKFRKETFRLQKRIYEASSCLLYTSPSPRDLSTSRMPSSA